MDKTNCNGYKNTIGHQGYEIEELGGCDTEWLIVQLLTQQTPDKNLFKIRVHPRSSVSYFIFGDQKEIQVKRQQLQV
ncbi:MAG: hypothetical protein E3K32_09080 [wastewater metagenome]|nr:hypothetical protein [Candidatus Loosdrechtia aerotolerans]